MNFHIHAFQPQNLHSVSWLSIQKCNKTYYNSEYISTAYLGKFLGTVGKKFQLSQVIHQLPDL